MSQNVDKIPTDALFSQVTEPQVEKYNSQFSLFKCFDLTCKINKFSLYFILYNQFYTIYTYFCHKMASNHDYTIIKVGYTCSFIIIFSFRFQLIVQNIFIFNVTDLQLSYITFYYYRVYFCFKFHFSLLYLLFIHAAQNLI